MHAAKSKAQISGTVINAHLISIFVFATKIVLSLFYSIQNFRLLAFFRDCTDLFVSDLVGSPKDRFSHVAAQLLGLQPKHNLSVHP